MFFVWGLIVKLPKRTHTHTHIYNKLFVILSPTNLIREGLCDPWIVEQGTISGKKSSGMKLELQSYSEKTSLSCDLLLI